MSDNSTARGLIRSLGIGQFNATMVIPYMFIAPATTDPRSAPIILLVQHLQAALRQVGLDVPTAGYLDVKTARAIERVAGPGWEQRPWADLCQVIVRARDTGLTWKVDRPPPSNFGPSGMQLGSINLPDVPGGLVTYGLAAAVAYHYWKKRKR